MPLEHFHNKEDYRKWLAYRHIHGIPSRATSVSVGGKVHKVKHSSLSKPRKSRRMPRRKGGR